MKADPADSVHARLDVLERALRRWRRAALLALVLVASAPVLAWVPQDPAPRGKPPVELPEVRGSRFALVDRVGRERAVLALQDGAPALRLMNRDGRTLLRVRLHGDREAQVLLADREGNTRLGLATAPNGEPHLILTDRHQKPRVQMTISERGAPGLLFIAEDGAMPAGLGVHADGRAWLLPEAAPRRDGGK